MGDRGITFETLMITSRQLAFGLLLLVKSNRDVFSGAIHIGQDAGGAIPGYSGGIKSTLHVCLFQLTYFETKLELVYR